ncbi:MAG: tripartite tricarboxylate transporter substrate binding protein [Proteobacteria bacterium]|nr:tripartite tricarboxylate transporter substrate binding protein [Burkholderiales bacterium]
MQVETVTEGRGLRRRQCELATIAVCASIATCGAGGAVAQTGFPKRPLRLIISVPPGGAADFTGRVLGVKLAEFIGQNVVIENRPSAGGIIASEFVVKSSADGHILLLSSSTTHGVAPVLYRKLNYDAIKDFTHIAMVAVLPGMMAIHSDIPAKTVKEFIALARAKPGGFLFASSGNGSAPQLMGEQFKIVTGAPMTHVPYKGSGPAVQDLAGGRVQVMFDGLPSLIGQIKGGRLRPLAALADKRFSVFPDVPTMVEAGFAGIEGGVWYGVSGPSGIPRAVVDRLTREIHRVIAQPDVQERFGSVGGIALPLGPKEYVAFIEKENRKWAEVIRVSGAVPD